MWSLRDELVLEIFPGIGAFGLGFERSGYTVVRGPDPLFGGDIRRFNPPCRRFSGVIGGDPCQAHGALANLVRAKGGATKFGDLSHEFQRVVEEAQPAWFLRENIEKAPHIAPAGFSTKSFVLDLYHLLDDDAGMSFEQGRIRRFWFGVREDLGEAPELRRWISFALSLSPERKGTVTGRHTSHSMGDSTRPGAKAGKPGKYSLDEMLKLQGLPADFLDHAPWTREAARRAIGNAVPLPMSEALALAIGEWRKSQ